MRRAIPVLLLIGALAVPAFGAKLTIRNLDKPGEGFNDPTPVEPVGGNDGTTLGEQRLNVFKAAAEAWGKVLDSNVEILIDATFSPIVSDEPCSATAAILGQASPAIAANFAGAPQKGIWYPTALANKFIGTHTYPGTTDRDIYAQFNADVDNQTCLGDTDWYYGFDRNAGNDWDLFVVVLHELGHGLGFSGGAARTGEFLQGLPTVFETHVYDTSASKRWDQMTVAERKASVLNTANVVFDGARTNAAARQWLQPTTLLYVDSPSTIAGGYDIGTATFGASPSSGAMTGSIVEATDAATEIDGDLTTLPSTTDGCTALTNAPAVAGKIALVDRGECAFTIKARNAQAAGAVGIVIVDNRKTECIPPGMAPSGDSSDIVIPVVSIRQADGATIRAQVRTGVTAQLRTDASQLAGTAREGSVRLYTPCTLKAGSSLYHFDVTASPNVLMEPDINTDLLHGMDITPALLLDLGWTAPPRTGRRILKR